MAWVEKALAILVVIELNDLTDSTLRILKADPRRSSSVAACGAVDRRDCTMMKHIILAEIRKSNAPAWVADEVEKKLNCHYCRRPASAIDCKSWQ